MELGQSSHEDRRWPRRPQWLVSLDRRAAASVERVTENIDDYVEHGNRLPEFRDRIRALAESQWGEQVVVAQLDVGFGPTYEVPGRRKDGTVKGKRLIRRFFWNIVRGLVNAVACVFGLFVGAFILNVFTGSGRVTGSENAPAVGLADAARSAKGPWLVYSTNPSGDSWLGYSPSHVAMVDSHNSNSYFDPEDVPPPKFLWHAEKPYTPAVSLRQQKLTWADGSVFEFHVSAEERSLLKQSARG